MKNSWFSVFLTVVLWTQSAVAEITPGPNPNKAGELALVVVASESPDYIKEWLSTPSSHAVTIKRIRVVKPEQLIIASFLVSGMSADENGNYSFSVSMYILGPDGKLILSDQNYAKGSGKLPEKPTFVMADPALDIILEESDPEGDYTIAAQVKDSVSREKADGSYVVKLIKDEL